MELDSPILRDLAGRAREVARAVVAPAAAELDACAGWPAEAMRALGDAGLMGLNAPAEVGGLGQGLTGLVAVSRELARESPSTALCFAMHCVGTGVIAAKATDFHKENYLRPIAEGRHVTTLALSEPGSGSHFWIPQTTLTPTDGGFTVQGVKSFVTNGAHADSYVVSTVGAPGTEPREEGSFSLVLVDAANPGIDWKEPWEGFGMRANSSRTMEIDGAELDANRLLGAVGDQLWYVFEVVAPYFLTAMAGTYLGVTEACIDEVAAHLGSRRHAHSGELLGAEPVLAHELGALWVEAEKTRQLIFAAARRADGQEAGAMIAVFAAKIAAAEAAVDVANRAMTLAGGIAYRDNSKLARMLRDARASHVMAPTTHTLKTWLGRALLKLPLL